MSQAGQGLAAFVLGEAPHRKTSLVLLGVCGAVLLGLALGEAWAGEDAFITFRTVDNFVNGYGLRWNVDERVQSYTHPLWMLVNVPLYWVTRDVATTTTVMGLLCTGAAFGVLGRRFLDRPLALMLLFASLAASTSFVLYSTSGFENSLSHLCFAAFAVLFLRAQDAASARDVSWLGLGLAASLAAVNRADMALVYTPPLLLLIARHGRGLPWRRFVAGFTPLVLWLAFSTFYYGFPYPNTALSKMNEEIAAGVLFRQGVYYGLDLWVRDPVGFGVLLIGIAITAERLAAVRAEGLASRAAGLASLGLGAVLYGLYVLSIGGCFLAGRHWTLPLLVFAIVSAERLAALRPEAVEPALWRVGRWILVLAVVLVASRPLVVDAVRGWEKSLRINERSRAHVFLDAGLAWRKTGYARQWQATGEDLPVDRATVRGAIGITGYYAPREARIVDFFGLADPLVARLPTAPRFRMVGHFRRAVPPGYLEVRSGGSLDALDPALRDYYAPLRSIVSDPLLDGERLRHLVAFHLGRYDDRLEDYLTRAPRP